MKNMKVALQLYSVRQAMNIDLEATLLAVKEMGYDYVEFAGYAITDANEMRALLDKYGLTAISIHQGLDPFFQNAEAAINTVKALGVKYCAIPWYPLEKLQGEEWNKTMKSFADYAKALSEIGVGLLYHNHDFEFTKDGDQYVMDKLYNTLGADIINPEFDTCWIHYAGEDPCKYIRKYAGRQNVLHLKDFVCKNLASGPVYDLIDANGVDSKGATKEDNGFEFRPLGLGIQDFPAIIAAAEEVGIEYLIVEQDNCYDTPVLEAARISREYLKKLGY